MFNKIISYNFLVVFCSLGMHGAQPRQEELVVPFFVRTSPLLRLEFLDQQERLSSGQKNQALRVLLRKEEFIGRAVVDLKRTFEFDELRKKAAAEKRFYIWKRSGAIYHLPVFLHEDRLPVFLHKAKLR